YLGSKRRLVPALGELAGRVGARTALDLFTGTTRVAQELKRRGAFTWAVDSARYSEALARCYVAADGRAVDRAELGAALARLDAAGAALRGDALELAPLLPEVDVAYVDPPYNQHSYYRNYHVWETLVAWDAPDHYGVACKRADCRDPATRSPFNSRPAFRDALARVLAAIRARVLVLSYNDEAWVGLDELVELCSPRGAVGVLAFDSKRYVGAQIGIHNPAGERVGRVGRLRDVEYLVVSGEEAEVSRALGASALAA